MTDVASAIAGSTPTTGTTPAYSYQGGGRVSTDQSTLQNSDFMQLLIKQLQNQDPSQPMDSNQIMQQTATLSSTQTMQQMIEVQQQQFALTSRMSASSFVGQTVSYTDAGGNARSGLVTGATFSQAGTPNLTIGGSSVALTSVTGITAAAAAASAGSGSGSSSASGSASSSGSSSASSSAGTSKSS